MTIDIGISEKDRAAIAGGLGKLLADTYGLYLKTHNFHWNVTGPMFQTLHSGSRRNTTSSRSPLTSCRTHPLPRCSRPRQLPRVCWHVIGA